MSKKKPNTPTADGSVMTSHDQSPTPTKPQGYRLEWVTAGSLTPNPQNWRTHPPEQAAAFKAILAKVGWTAPVLFNETTGHIIDGHLRQKSVPPETVIPVIFCQLTPEQEAVALATHDPLSQMAGTDAAMLEQLMNSVELAGDLSAIADDLDALIAQTTADGEGSGDGEGSEDDNAGSDGDSSATGETGGASGGGDARDKLKPSYQVIAECTGEEQQQLAYNLLKRRGIPARVTTMYGTPGRSSGSKKKR